MKLLKKIFAPILISTCLLKGMEERQVRAELLMGLDQLCYRAGSNLLDRIEGCSKRKTNKARRLWQLLGNEDEPSLKFLAAATLLKNQSLISNNIPQELEEYLRGLKNDLGSKVINLVRRHGELTLDKEEREELSQLSFLIHAGANLTIVDENEDTALMCASRNGYRLIVEQLVLGGANINVQTHSTALILAIINHHDDEVASLFINLGCDLDLNDKEGNTALMYATKKGKIKIAKKLVEAFANTDIQNKSGKTALMFSISGCDELTSRFAQYRNKKKNKIAKKLIKSMVDLDLQDENGRTALMKCLVKGNSSVAKMLIDACANLDLQDNSGYTALMWAVYKGNTEIRELLAEKNAALNLRAIIKCTLI